MSPPAATSTQTFVYAVDAHNRIVWVSSEWESFAGKNEASHLTRANVQGRSLFHYITDAETRYLYREILHRVRTDQATLVLPFRCDNPSVRRFMELTITPAAEGTVVFEGRILREEPRESVRLMESATRRSGEFLRMCSWCKRVDVRGEWLEVKKAVLALKLFHPIRLPRITHGICKDCSRSVVRKTKQAILPAHRFFGRCSGSADPPTFAVRPNTSLERGCRPPTVT